MFTGVINGSASSSQRSSVSARQMRPRPFLAMKLIAAAVTFVVLLSIGAGWRHAEPARDVVPVA